MIYAYRVFYKKLEKLLENPKLSTLAIVEEIGDFISENERAIGDPIKDALEETWGLPYEDLLCSLLMEQILILSTHSTLDNEFNRESREEIARQCVWRIQILRKLLKKHCEEKKEQEN